MAKYGVQVDKVQGEGAVKLEIQYRDKALRLFSKRDMNAILADAARKMGLAWIARWLPKRFTNYAYTLGYDVTANYYDYKKSIDGEAVPLVGPSPKIRARRGNSVKAGGYLYGTANDGDKLISSANQASATATSPGGNPSVTIRIPTSHPIAAIVSATLRTVPSLEIKDIAKVFAQALTASIDGADTSDPERSKLTATQRSSMTTGRASAAKKSGRAA